MESFLVWFVSPGGWNLLPEDSISPWSFHPPSGDGNLLAYIPGIQETQKAGIIILWSNFET